MFLKILGALYLIVRNNRSIDIDRQLTGSSRMNELASYYTTTTTIVWSSLLPLLSTSLLRAIEEEYVELLLPVSKQLFTLQLSIFYSFTFIAASLVTSLL